MNHWKQDIDQHKLYNQIAHEILKQRQMEI